MRWRSGNERQGTSEASQAIFFGVWLGCVLVMLPFIWLIGGGWPAMLGTFVGLVVGCVLLMVFADKIPTPSVTDMSTDSND